MKNNLVNISIEQKLKNTLEWWEGKNAERPCLSFSIRKQRIQIPDLNISWNSPDIEPDLETMVNNAIKHAESLECFCEKLPTLPHNFGNRGMPMILASYLGGKAKFTPETVWIDPVIKDWNTFEIIFNEKNLWFKKSFDFFKLAFKKSCDNDFPLLPVLPDFGDFLTVFSLLRGIDNLLLDLLENKERVLEARDKFLKVWPIYHKKFWELYSSKFPGDLSWLIWAPGKTYGCQCDFSTMISPEMFIEFVVPEIEVMSKYLDYMVWHLDGPEEIKHLDILLELPQIKAIQWVPGASKPPAASPEWIGILKKIKNKGRRLWLDAYNEKEIEILIRELGPEGVFIQGGFTGKTKEEAENFVSWVNKISKESRKKIKL